MSIITLFNANNPVSALNAQSASYYSESEKNISEKFKNIQQFEPPLDFVSASNWCYYGSLELYYEYGFKKVYQTYPYDGSAYEKNVYRNNSSQIDNYILDNLYPKSTGYANFLSGTFSQSGSALNAGSGRTYIIGTAPEYITTLGGPHTASAGMAGKPLHQTFDDSNKYDVALRRESNLEFDFSYGNTIEFWMNKPAFLDTAAKEVVFDLNNAGTIAGSNAGRLTIELDPATTPSPFIITIESGSSTTTFTLGSNITSSTTSGVRELSNGDKFHHYAFAFLSSSSGTRVNFFYDGNLTETKTSSTGFARVTGSLKSTIGCLSGRTTVTSTATIGHGQFSGSLDDFRYWKYDRPADLVKLNYFKGIDGGTNTDDESYQLGVYYKFNEGITQIASTDSTVLDYSGRISNGVWTGYNAGSRNTGSAITSNGIETELADPIIRSSHPTVIADMETYRITGSYYDQENNSYFYNLFPEWVREEDLEESGLLKELAHIGASYFDTIHHQIKFFKDIKNKEYLSSSAKPITFADSLVENMGLTVSNLFINSNIYEKVLNQDENELYDMTLFDVKNQIYHNIYNNIHSILKSKGTVDGFRNFLRSFGVNEEIVKLRMYTDKDTFFLNDNYKLQTEPIKFANFYNADHLGASIIQATSSISDLNYVEFSEGTNEKFSSFTMEANVLFPKKFQAGENGYVGMTNISSSIFGFHRPDISTVGDYTWQDSGRDLSNLQIYAVKDTANGKDVKFQLRDNASSPTINLTTSFLQEVYDNTTWNISVRLKPSGSAFTGFSGYGTTTPNYILEFYGANYHNGEQRQTFYESKVLSTIAEKKLITADKRFYVGAHCTNFTGAVLQQADTRVSTFRLWHSHLSNEELNAHAKDFTSHGVISGSKNPALFEDSITTYFPKMDSLALNWNFDSVTGSDSSGEFLVYDISSGSAAGLTQYGWHSGSIGVRHGGQGINFLTSSSKVVDKNYIITAKSIEPGNALLDDLINIREEFEALKTDYNDVTDNFFSIEKSPYAVLSSEMLKFFSLSKDINYLVGNPVNRYRSEYKELADLKQIYFRNIENDVDVERFFDYYKWIDQSFNQIINQLIPFSTRHSENVSNVIESHILERPKYQAKLPVLRKFTATEGAAQGFNTLMYNWNTGHAPVSSNPNLNCNWQLTRKERTGTNSTEREVLRKAINNVHPIEKLNLYDIVAPASYEGSTFVRTSLNKPYKVSITSDNTIHSGVNYSNKKDKILFHNALEPHGVVGAGPFGVPQNIITVGVGAGTGIVSQRDCDDSILTKVNFSSEAELGKYFGNEYLHELKGHHILPHNLKNEIVQTGYNEQVSGEFRYDVVFTNLHTDTVDDTNVIPMQGPFTQTHVGGHQSRHVPINKYDVNKTASITTYPTATQATGQITFTIGNLSVGDTVTITDGDLNEVIAQLSTYFDVFTERWTTATELAQIISDKLDITATATTAGQIDLVSNIYGTDGNQAISTSTVNITITGLSGAIAGTPVPVTSNIDSPNNRPEAWGLVTKEHSSLNSDNDGAFGFVGADYGGGGLYPNTAKLRATRFRDEHAKRPLNIRNIQYDENSSFAGNYRKGIEILQISRAANRRWYREAYDLGLVVPAIINTTLPNTTHYFTLVGSKTAVGKGNVFGKPSQRNLLFLNHPTPRTDLTSSTHEIVTRFSAPGGSEVQTIGYLDAQTQTFSAYNAMPYRNLTVRSSGSGEDGTIRASTHTIGGVTADDRRGLRSLLQRQMGKFGQDAALDPTVSALTYGKTGSFQKQHPNRRIGFKRVESVYSNSGYVAQNASAEVSEIVDNGYVNKVIPSQDFGYSWIANLYAQASGSLSDPQTANSSATVLMMTAMRWTNFTPEQLLYLVSFYSETIESSESDGTPPAIASEAAFLLLQAGFKEIVSRMPVVVGYAPASGKQRCSGSLGFYEQSSHIFPTISDVYCCDEIVAPTITVTTPDFTSNDVLILGASYTTDFGLMLVGPGSAIIDNTNIYASEIDNIIYKVSFSDCCDESEIKYAMVVYGSVSASGAAAGFSSVEPLPVYYSSLPLFPSSNGVPATINHGLVSETSGKVYIKIFAKDCEEQVSTILITLSTAHIA
tara:strand:- start:10865 stop:17143 length:6279 start_codon:yes stop_codon:yes gene_type:complete